MRLAASAIAACASLLAASPLAAKEACYADLDQMSADGLNHFLTSQAVIASLCDEKFGGEPSLMSRHLELRSAHRDFIADSEAGEAAFAEKLGVWPNALRRERLTEATIYWSRQDLTPELCEEIADGIATQTESLAELLIAITMTGQEQGSSLDFCEGTPFAAFMATETPELGPPTALTDPGGRWRLSAPSGWRVWEGQGGNPTVGDDVLGWNCNVASMRNPGLLAYGFERFVDESVENGFDERYMTELRRQIAGVQFANLEKTPLAGRTGLRYDMAFRMNGADLAAVQHTAMDGAMQYVVTCVAGGEELPFARFVAFDRIFASFEFTD